MNEYQPDDFLVDDNAVDEDEGYDPQVMNPDQPEAVIESELNSSDLDVMEDRPTKPRKRIKKPRHDDDDMDIDRDEGRQSNDDMGDFIVNERPNRERPLKVKKPRAHDIFNTENIDVQTQISKEPKTNKIYTREEIEEQYATEKDFKIKISDIPERILKNFTDE
jgi:hypothetical protein